MSDGDLNFAVILGLFFLMVVATAILEYKDNRRKKQFLRKNQAYPRSWER